MSKFDDEIDEIIDYFNNLKKALNGEAVILDTGWEKEEYYYDSQSVLEDLEAMQITLSSITFKVLQEHINALENQLEKKKIEAN